MLRKLCQAYIWIVDNYPDEQSRAVIHDFVMDVFTELGIEYADRQEAAAIARAIAGNGAYALRLTNE